MTENPIKNQKNHQRLVVEIYNLCSLSSIKKNFPLKKINSQEVYLNVYCLDDYRLEPTTYLNLMIDYFFCQARRFKKKRIIYIYIYIVS